MDFYHVKFVDFNRSPRSNAGRYNPWDQFCHIRKFRASDDDEAKKKAKKIIRGSRGPFAVLWNGDRRVVILKG